MKILSATQIRDWDAYTIKHEPIASIDLMERASAVFTNWFSAIYTTQKPVILFCGNGNNGGDGLAIARLLHRQFYDVQVYICAISATPTVDFEANFERLPERAEILRGVLQPETDFPILPTEAVIIDAILGSGLARPVAGYWARLIEYINQLPNEVVSVDIPSGLFCDSPTNSIAIEADRVLSFEIPKLAFLMPDNQRFIKSFEVQSIGLKADYLHDIADENIWVTPDLIQIWLRPRQKFDHKGSYGHALLAVGSAAMGGAAVLSAKACMRSGVGLLTVHSAAINRTILLSAVPEAMVSFDNEADCISSIQLDKKYSAIGIGCGIGKDPKTINALANFFKNTTSTPLILDADALNIIAENPDLKTHLPEGAILTPHLKEFERLFGKTADGFERLNRLRQIAKTLKVNILLKGAYSVVATTEGVCYFNSTGNAGMATAGSGDVLTGIITGLLAQGYPAYQAAVMGAYFHGLAGDKAAAQFGQSAMIASDIVDNLRL